MLAAYDARSVIVHGAIPREKTLVDLNRQRVTINVFVSVLEGVLRRAFQIAIHLVASEQTFPPDWEALMFSGPQDLTAS